MYKVPFVNYPEHYRRIWDEVMNAITGALSKGDLILRDQLRQFEDNIASFVGVKYAVGVNSGTDALYLSLKAAGVGQGDEVITVAHTFVATVSAIVQCGAKTVLIDIGEDMNMDVSQVEKAITPKTKAIIPVYLNGQMCDMGRLMEIANEHDLLVIEGAAQALGATFDGKKAGSFGLTGCFSFYPAKMLGAAGDGGIVVTNDEEMAEKIRLLRDHGYQRSTGDILCYGYNSRLDNVQAAILDVKLKHLPEWIDRRRELASRYHQRLSELQELKLPPLPLSNDRFFDVYQNYVIRVKERDRLVAHLTETGIEILVSWLKPMHHHETLGLKHFYLPKTEQISKEVLSLPMYPELSDEKVEFVIEAPRNFYNNKSEVELDDYRSRNRDEYFQSEAFLKNLKVLEKVKHIAKRLDSTSAQIALRWVLENPCVTVEILGAKNAHQVAENIGALDYTLSKEDMEFLKEDVQNAFS